MLVTKKKGIYQLNFISVPIFILPLAKEKYTASSCKNKRGGGIIQKYLMQRNHLILSVQNVKH